MMVNDIFMNGDKSERIFGFDALQAYCMTYKRLEVLFRELSVAGYRFYLPESCDVELDILSVYF